MINKNTVILGILIFTITISEAFGQYLLRIYYNSKHRRFKRTDQLQFIPQNFLPYVTWICYGLCTFLLSLTYKYTTMGKAEVYWDAMSTLIVPLISTFAFKEQLGYQGWTGIFFVILGSLILANSK